MSTHRDSIDRTGPGGRTSAGSRPPSTSRFYPLWPLGLLALLLLAGCASLTAYQRMGSADAAYREGDYRRAVERYTAVIEADSEHRRAYYRRALSRVRLREGRAALRDVNRHLELKPRSVDGLLLKGDLLHWLGRHDEAREYYDHALNMTPASASARPRASRGRLSYQVLDHDRAVEDFEAVLELEGIGRRRRGKAHLYRALIAFEEGVNRRAHDHLDAAEEVLGSSSWQAGYHLIRGVVLLDEGRGEAAPRRIERAVELEGGVVEYLLDRVADKYRDFAVESPYPPDGFFLAARSFDRRGQPRAAERLAREALRENPESGAYRTFLDELDAPGDEGGSAFTWQGYLMESYRPE